MIIPEIIKPFVKMCYFIPDENKHQYEFEEGQILFDDMSALKLYCLRHTYAINMPALIEKNCKVCYGTGRNGRNAKTGEINHCYKCLMKNLHKRIVELVKMKRYEPEHA